MFSELSKIDKYMKAVLTPNGERKFKLTELYELFFLNVRNLSDVQRVNVTATVISIKYQTLYSCFKAKISRAGKTPVFYAASFGLIVAIGVPLKKTFKEKK